MRVQSTRSIGGDLCASLVSAAPFLVALRAGDRELPVAAPLPFAAASSPIARPARDTREARHGRGESPAPVPRPRRLVRLQRAPQRGNINEAPTRPRGCSMTVFRNAKVVDGTGGPAMAADVVVDGG